MVAMSASAQKGLKLGFFALPQTSVLYNQDDMDLDDELYQLEVLPGMAGGLVFGYHFNDVFGFRMNAIYSQEGGRYSARRDFSTDDFFTTRLEYLKVPVMLGFNTSPLFNKVMFAAYAGVQGNLLTRANTYYSNPAYLEPRPAGAYRLPSTRDRYETLTYSAVLDLGMDVFLTRRAVFNLRLRGDLGLTDSENKAASYQFTEGGSSGTAPYYEWLRGSDAKAETSPLNLGLLFGFTFTLGKDAVALPVAPLPPMPEDEPQPAQPSEE